jgi:hypothetical protein
LMPFLIQPDSHIHELAGIIRQRRSTRFRDGRQPARCGVKCGAEVMAGKLTLPAAPSSPLLAPAMVAEFETRAIGKTPAQHFPKTAA